MKLGNLWDVQVLVYVLLTTVVVVLTLVVLAVINRRVRVISGELESIRRDLKLLEDGVRTVTESLTSRAAAPAAPASKEGE
jgi:uncharacterized protein (DUF3084 family)